jgi:prepilin-type processing-associated H-X9-DG protein
MAAWACLGIFIGPTSRVQAADSPPASRAAPNSTAAEHLDLTYIPAEAVSVIVAHPQAVLTGPDAEWIPVEVITAQGMKEWGFDPLKIQEAVVLFAPPTQGTDPDFAAILRLSEAYSKAAVTAKLVGMEKNIDGKAVVETTLPGARPIWLHLPDDKTIMIGTAPLVGKMLVAKDAKSPLVELLKKVDVSSHLTAVFSIDAVRPIMKQAVAAAPPVPPQFQGFLKLPDLLSALLLRVNIGERFQASLTLRARDDASSEEVERLVSQGLMMARQLVTAQIAAMPRGSNDPVQEASMKYLTRITDKLFSSLKLARKGENVSISVDTGSSIATIGLLGAFLLPATELDRRSERAAAMEARAVAERDLVIAAQAAAERNPTTSKMRQIGLALLNYHSAHQRFPARAIFDKQGKPLLSWRVQILPMLEENELFKQFHLDEPWDSEHNKPLVAKMPAVFRDPRRPPDGTTTFLAVVGKGLAFEGDKPLKISQFFDGASNTVLVVQANNGRAVQWTKPDDLEVDLTKPMAGLGDAEPNGFAALFADGHVTMLPKTIKPEVLSALFTRAGGEVIDSDDLKP